MKRLIPRGLVLSQINRRYDLLVAGLARVQREKDIPPDALAGLKYGDLYWTLDGMCEAYFEARTPPEIQTLREDLHRKLVDLFLARKVAPLEVLSKPADDRGRDKGLALPLPPNQTGGSPASGSPVSGFVIL